jgi:hypothetical protein
VKKEIVMALRYPRVSVLLAVPLATAACIGAEIDEESEELVGMAEGELISSNSMLPNALHRNALTSTALAPNMLGQTALTWAALTGAARAALQDPGTNGNLSRELLRYVVSCALRPNQTFSFSWTDASGAVRSEVYPGGLGIADWWVYGPLTDPLPQRYISACLAARTNWYGVSVQISLRASQTSLASSVPERDSYKVREGAFWGNLFSGMPYLRACYSPAGAARARELQRDCAAGHLSVDPVSGASTAQACGAIAIAGSCDMLCNSVSSDGGFYSGCVENPAVSSWVRTDLVITSFLPP